MPISCHFGDFKSAFSFLKSAIANARLYLYLYVYQCLFEYRLDRLKSKQEWALLHINSLRRRSNDGDWPLCHCVAIHKVKYAAEICAVKGSLKLQKNAENSSATQVVCNFHPNTICSYRLLSRPAACSRFHTMCR